jgi:hypothetical protein
LTEGEKRRRKDAVRRAIGKVRPFEETHPHLKEFSAFLKDLNKETERGAALAAAAYLDDLLEKTIRAFLIVGDTADALLRGFNAPLGGLSSRIAAAHALGLISDAEKSECEVIRKVRNEFAHKVRMSFDDDRVKGLCRNLTMNAKPYEGVTVSTRGAFTTAAVALILNLTNRPHYVGKKRLSAGEWPY